MLRGFLAGLTEHLTPRGEGWLILSDLGEHLGLRPRAERKLIKKIDKTLQLIEDEEYGWCESCGVEIGIRRLEARPTADMCVDCKTLAEIKEKQVGK